MARKQKKVNEDVTADIIDPIEADLDNLDDPAADTAFDPENADIKESEDPTDDSVEPEEPGPVDEELTDDELLDDIVNDIADINVDDDLPDDEFMEEEDPEDEDDEEDKDVTEEEDPEDMDDEEDEKKVDEATSRLIASVNPENPKAFEEDLQFLVKNAAKKLEAQRTRRKPQFKQLVESVAEALSAAGFNPATVKREAKAIDKRNLQKIAKLEHALADMTKKRVVAECRVIRERALSRINLQDRRRVANRIDKIEFSTVREFAAKVETILARMPKKTTEKSESYSRRILETIDLNSKASGKQPTTLIEAVNASIK